MKTPSFLLSFWLAAAPDPWRGIAPHIARIVQADRDQVAFKEAAQVIAAAIQSKLHTTPIDCGLHLWRAGEREGHVSAAGGFLGAHFQKWLIRVPTITEPTIQRIISNLASLISPRTFSISVRSFSNCVSNHERS